MFIFFHMSRSSSIDAKLLFCLVLREYGITVCAVRHNKEEELLFFKKIDITSLRMADHIKYFG